MGKVELILLLLLPFYLFDKETAPQYSWATVHGSLPYLHAPMLIDKERHP